MLAQLWLALQDQWMFQDHVWHQQREREREWFDGIEKKKEISFDDGTEALGNPF